MKTPNTQLAWVLTQLVKKGRVTRNQALNHNITRLASCICNIKEMGYKIVPRQIRKQGRMYDYEYSIEVVCTK